MPTLLNSTDRDALIQRLRHLQPAAQPKWGAFTASRMVCHLADSLRVGVGDLPTVPTYTLPSRTLVKWIVVYSPVSPPKAKIQTAPEMLSSAPGTWADDVSAVEQLIHRLGTQPTTATHPYFGPLSHDGWGRLAWKHLDHHLRQFGC